MPCLNGFMFNWILWKNVLIFFSSYKLLRALKIFVSLLCLLFVPWNRFSIISLNFQFYKYYMTFSSITFSRIQFSFFKRLHYNVNNFILSHTSSRLEAFRTSLQPAMSWLTLQKITVPPGFLGLWSSSALAYRVDFVQFHFSCMSSSFSWSITNCQLYTFWVKFNISI